MSLRGSKFAVTLLLLISLIVVSSPYLNIPQLVLAAPSVTLTPGFSPRGAIISVEGTGFSFPNGTKLGSNVNGAGGHPVQCNFFSLDGNNVPGTLITSPICNLASVDNSSISGSFLVSVLIPTPIPNPYTFILNMTDGDRFIKAQTTFVVTAITINPTTGPQGTIVNVTGSLSASDTGCSFTAPTTTSTTTSRTTRVSITTITAPLFGGSSCVISGSTGGNFTGSFVVGTVGPGPYTVRVTGSSGDFVETTFTVTAPFIVLNPAKGGVGTFVTVTGVGFSYSDTSCSLSSPTSSSFVASPACAIFTYGNGTRQPLGSFTVGNVAVGFYILRLTGNTGNFAEALFNVTQVFVPTLAITPPDGPRGTIVKVTGNGFRTSDTSCQLTSSGPGADPFLITSPFCSMSSGTVTAQFTVGTSATPGTRAVNVTGSSGDKAGINFIVDTFPTIRAVPATGVAGTFAFVSLTGGQFSSGDQGSCTISSSPSGLFSSSNCVIQNSGLSLNGTNFIVAGGASGFYTITVKGSQGDSAFTTFTANVTATLVLSATNATNGALITFRGTGFSITDSGACSVLAYIEPAHTVSNLLITSPTCTISSQVATGSFVVGPSATTDRKWNVTVRGSPQNDQPAYALFNVTASITVSPTSGTINSVVSFSGSGFSSTATTCTATISPAMGTLGTNLPICGVNAPIGQVSGSFTVPTNAAQGLYVITVTDNTGKRASGTFTVGTPTAQITITPNAITPGNSVAISGSGFNGNDTVCTVTSGTPTLSTTPASPSCAISGGFVSSAFTVNTGATPGMYLITVTGKNGSQSLDFASNFLFVGGVFTVSTSTSSTTTTSTTPTSSTTTTFTTVVSTSLTTTTYSTTGILTQSFFHTTVTTVSGITQTTISALTTIFQTSTSMTTVTTTITTTAPIGLAAQQRMQVAGPGAFPDNLGLVTLLLFVVPLLFRRLFT